MYFNRILQLKFFLFFATSVLVHAGSPVRIAAVVNHHIISETDLKNRINLALISSGEQNTPQAHKALTRQILNLMIGEQLQLQLGEQFKIPIDDDMIEAAMTEIEKQNGMEEGELKNVLTQHHIPDTVMKNHLKANIIWREYIRERYKDAVQISEAEITRALKQLEAAKNTRRYALSEILIASNNNQKPSESLALAQRIVQQLKNGAQFTALAEQFSNASSASRGGDIGWVSRSNLDGSLVKELDKTPPGHFSEPILTERGYYIFYLKDRLEPGEIGKSEDYLTFKQILLPHPEDAFEFEIRDTLNRAHVLAKSISSCKVAEKLVNNAHGRIQTASRVPASNLPSELRKLLMNLRPDQAASPVNTEGGALIFVLCAKETINPQTPSRDDIRDKLVEEKLQLIAEREMRNLRRAAHVEIRLK
jgi:peptidyl-prolyl cis-trans isomerase SurA